MNGKWGWYENEEDKDNEYFGQIEYGNKYVGEWKDGKYNGQGTYTRIDGNRFEGEWKDGKFNGQGTYTFSNGGSFVGLWKDSAPWNISGYNEKGEFVKYVDGKEIKQ